MGKVCSRQEEMRNECGILVRRNKEKKQIEIIRKLMICPRRCGLNKWYVKM
jgi:hypothetical protein